MSFHTRIPKPRPRHLVNPCLVHRRSFRRGLPAAFNHPGSPTLSHSCLCMDAQAPRVRVGASSLRILVELAGVCSTVQDNRLSNPVCSKQLRALRRLFLSSLMDAALFAPSHASPSRLENASWASYASEHRPQILIPIGGSAASLSTCGSAARFMRGAPTEAVLLDPAKCEAAPCTYDLCVHWGAEKKRAWRAIWRWPSQVDVQFADAQHALCSGRSMEL